MKVFRFNFAAFLRSAHYNRCFVLPLFSGGGRGGSYAWGNGGHAGGNGGAGVNGNVVNYNNASGGGGGSGGGQRNRKGYTTR